MESITNFLDPKSQPNTTGDESVDVEKELDKKESDLEDDSDTIEVNLSDKEEKPSVKSVTLPATKEKDTAETEVATGDEAKAEDNAAESAPDDIDNEKAAKEDDAEKAVEKKAEEEPAEKKEEKPAEEPKKEEPKEETKEEPKQEEQKEAETPADETDAENPESEEAEESSESAEEEQASEEDSASAQIDDGNENDLEADQNANPPLLKLIEEFEYKSTKVYETPNGARIVYSYVPESELCYTMFSFKVGSFYEDDSNYGVSHLLEHLMFNGCPGMSALEFNEKLDKLGMSVNAFTDRMETAYHFNGLKENFVTAFDLFANLIKSFTPTDEIVDKERGVVLNEIGVYEDDSWSVLHEAIHANAYRQHPISHPILGYENVIRNISTNQVKEWYEKNYTSNNLTVYLVGDFPEEDLVYVGSKIQLFDPGEKNADPVITDVMAQPVYKNVITKKEGITQTLIDTSLQFKKEAFNFYELDILARVLGGTMSSYLWNEFREERSIAYRVGAYSSTLDVDHLMIHLYAGLNDAEEAEEAKKIFHDALAFAKAITEEDFNKGQNIARLSELKSDETLSGVQDNVREALYMGFNLDDYITTLRNLTFDSYQAFAEQIDPDAMVTGILYPLNS